jgi:hypothetical protein
MAAVVKNAYMLINMELGDHLPVIQLVSFSTVSKGILYHYS